MAFDTKLCCEIIFQHYYHPLNGLFSFLSRTFFHSRCGCLIGTRLSVDIMTPPLTYSKVFLLSFVLAQSLSVVFTMPSDSDNMVADNYQVKEMISLK